MNTTQDRNQLLTDLGFTLAIIAGPMPNVKDNWPNIKFIISLSYKGREVVQSDYSLGIGHVTLPETIPNYNYTFLLKYRFSADEESLLRSWVKRPGADFVDKKLQASVAVKLAIAQKVKPTLPDVVYSLLSDGTPFFNAQSFEDWAGEFGYDLDSRKAEAIYKICFETGRKIAAVVPVDVRVKTQEIMQDY